MKDIEDIIERTHAHNAQLLQQEAATHTPTAKRKPYRLATAAAILLALIIVATLPWHGAEVHEPVIVQAEKRQPEYAVAPSPTEKEAHTEHYEHTTSKEGLLVYCENQCNADEVIARLDYVIQNIN